MTDKKDTPQEIDLLELFSNIGNWFKNLGQSALSLFVTIAYFFLRNAIWFILFIVAGGAIGFSFHKVADLYYNAEMVAFSNTITNSEAIKIINNWNYTTTLTEEQSSNIKNVSATYLLDINDDGIWDIAENTENIDLGDTTTMNMRIEGYFSITIEVYDTAMISVIKESIYSHLTNNSRVVEQNKIRLIQKKELIQKYSKEIADLDSLKNIEYFDRNKPKHVKLGDMFLMTEKDMPLYYNQIINLTKSLQELQEDLFLNKEPFEIILDFSVPSVEDNNLIYTIIKFIKLFFIIGLIVILLFDQRKVILSIIKESKE